MIDVLKQALKSLTYVYASGHPLLTSLRAAIAELEKVEPVAWMADSDSPFFMHPAMHRDDDIGFIPLYRHPAPVAPAGWKLVPEVPTDGMIEAMWNYETFADLYESILAAAPEYKPNDQ